VRHEYCHVASADFRRGRAAFMATFIEQNPLYFTAEVPLGRDYSSRVISDRHPSEGRAENK
jgi:predicted metal-dependent HD superfamily phosphohydrolase